MPRRLPPLLLALLLALGPGAVQAQDPTPQEAPPPHAVVLLYHRFDETAYPSTDIRADQFDAQLDHLAQGGFTVWPLQRIVAALQGKEPIPDRVVAITVDDAYRSVYTVAFPRLKARGWPFTVFVATDAVDAGSASLLTWDQMREMARSGATFANHSATHAHLIRRVPGEDEAAWGERVQADLAQARARLTAELGADPPLFAYPYGEYNLELAKRVRAMGYVPFGQQSGALGPGSDPAALPRYPVSEQYADPDAFALKVASLPLPASAVAPRSPVVTAQNPPRLEMTLAPSDPDPDRLTCYLRGDRLPVEWLDRASGRLAVTAPDPLPPGRSRYNCTAPSRAWPGRYYWYSHLWIR
jgi:biofilm PGA synthesis lipoprotein PgaB